MTPESSSDDKRLAAVFAALDVDAAPPDDASRERIASQLAEALEPVVERSPDKPTQRSSRMFLLATRGLAAAVVAAMAVGVGLWTTSGPGEASDSFEVVWNQVAEAETLQLAITRDGCTGQAWTQSGLLRWDSPDGTYAIARGARTWHIDERENRASIQPVSYFADDRSSIKLLALLEVNTDAPPKELLEARPTRREKIEQVDCHVYQCDLPSDDETGAIHIEAFAAVEGLALQRLTTSRLTGTRFEPIATLSVVAVNKPVDESKFVVGRTLTEDGRIGKVVDARGIVTIRPRMQRRWTPLDAPGMLLRPGDWVRTDARGANAVSVRLAGGAVVTIGPASVVELVSPAHVRTQSGSLQVVTDKQNPIRVEGPNSTQETVRDKEILSIARETLTDRAMERNILTRNKNTPKWLAAFEGASSDESIGSLVVQVDGRDVPLTVGYHKVTVDIRDQIARTVIEESFVNHTRGRLEGVFYFPLPQDASISGFGMWIGSELVEADVVEKQRAREIYETILRERRDPGLLEWSGGNLFKARVFPIEARSEKRVKISYTQVLPRKGNGYRYGYALRSELLKQHPLRELAIDVRLSSTLPLARVASPTHDTVRTQRTEHTARVEFTAQEYTPTRDFEVVVTLADDTPEVVVIPHRRGDDGYFMALIAPPTETDKAGASHRDLLPDGDPLDLLILADTSGSMSQTDRHRQSQFLAALLASLSPEDRFNLAVCDVDCHFAFDKRQSVGEATTREARDFLEARKSLGWTDLELALTTVLPRCKANTHVIYVGDGISTTGKADPVAVANRLRRLKKGTGSEPNRSSARQNAQPRGACPLFQQGIHTVSVGSTFESGVLRAMASLGNGGSVRAIDGGRDVTTVARELLGELTRPAIGDLEVMFEGLRTARVYPAELPNLATGSQHVVLGRYLPEGEKQTGRVVVTGRRGDEPLRWTVPVSLAQAEQGNSFLPRLWARMHLDTLLAQGDSPSIRDEVIALSEEYHIMTPHTSFLVLETDADRERFGVKRRFQMRDAQRFFADGRSRVDFELMQQQMQAAGLWRLGLRRQVLRELGGLGRNMQWFSADNTRRDWNVQRPHYYSGGSQWSKMIAFEQRTPSEISERFSPGANWGFVARKLAPQPQPPTPNSRDSYFSNGPKSGSIERDPVEFGGSWSSDYPGLQLAERKGEESWQRERFELNRRIDDYSDYSGHEPLNRLFDREVGSSDLLYVVGKPIIKTKNHLSLLMRGVGYGGDRGGPIHFASDRTSNPARSASPYAPQPLNWIDHIFPSLPSPPTQPAPPKPSAWSAEARKLAASLSRREVLATVDGGLRVTSQGESFQPRWEVLDGRSKSELLLAPDRWLNLRANARWRSLLAWCDSTERGVVDQVWLLGKVRKSEKMDLTHPPGPSAGYADGSLERTHSTYNAVVTRQAEDRAVLTLTHATNPEHAKRLTIDTHRHVLLRQESFRNEESFSLFRYDDFQEVLGTHWAGRIESFDGQGRLAHRTIRLLEPLSAEAFAKQYTDHLAIRQQCQILALPLPSVDEAKKAAADGSADHDDQLVLMAHFAGSQQWDRAFEHLDASEKLAIEGAAVRWLRYTALNNGRRQEELRTLLLSEAESLARSTPDEHLMAGELDTTKRLVDLANGLEANERLQLLDLLRPIHERQPKYLEAMKTWKEWRVSALDSSNQREEALALRKELVEEFPHRYNLHEQYANALSNVGEHEAAVAWLDRMLADESRWMISEEGSLRRTIVRLLRNQRRYGRMVEQLEAWVARNPSNYTAYGQYLTGLLHVGREKEVTAFIAKQLRDARLIAAESRPADFAKLTAAIHHALGRGYNHRVDRIDERWHAPLAETAWTMAFHPTHSYLADTIMNEHRFQSTDACRDTRKRATTKLLVKKQLDTLSRTHVERLVNWSLPNDPVVEKHQWEKIIQGLRRRWTAESDIDERHAWGELLTRVIGLRVGPVEKLAFVREKLETADDKFRQGYRNELFELLLAQPYSPALEDEAFALLPVLSDADDANRRLAVQVHALHRLTDRMVAARHAQATGAIEHPEKLTRTELTEKREEYLRAARESFVERLDVAIQAPEAMPEALRPWLIVERIYLRVLMEDDLAEINEDCWELLPAEPPAVDATLDFYLRERLLATLTNLAVRRSATPDRVERLLAYLDRAIDANPKDASPKMRKYLLLLALDRPEEIERALRAWIVEEDAPSAWRVSLGYLLAELGKLPEAIDVFEAIERADELGPAEYRALATWYQATDRRADYEEANIAIYQTADEWGLRSAISQRFQPWQRHDGEIPAELDEDVLLMFRALFAKSSSPQQHLYLVQQFYRESRDFRLLAGLADAVVGHSAGRVYPFLEGMTSTLSEIREEATVDEVVARIATVRDRAKTPVDQRALDLLEVLVERRAAEMINQPGPHGENALASLRRAFEREWSDGEERLMAHLLASMGAIAYDPLAEEQRRELGALRQRVEPGTSDRMHISLSETNTLFAYNQRSEAVDLLTAALDEYRKANDGVLPVDARDGMDRLVFMHESMLHFALGETFLLEERPRAVNAEQADWMLTRLYQLYRNTVAGDGTVTLGTGQTLYENVEQQWRDAIETEARDRANLRRSLITELAQFYRAAHAKRFEGTADDLRAFAFKQLPELLTPRTDNDHSIISTYAETLRHVAGPRDGLAFLIERLEQEPKWLRDSGRDGWSRHGYQLGRYRAETKQLGDLEPRLLVLVLDELQRDLRSQRRRNHSIYWKHHGYYWSDKEADFARTADEVHADRKDSLATVKYIANYLFEGIDHYDRAIEMLADAHRREILDDAGQSTLVDYLHERRRFGESIAILEPLVKRQPTNISHPVRLMHAYFQTQQPERLLELLDQTDAFFHEENRWNESAMAQLARSCQANQLWDRSVAYFDEAISLHQRTRPNRGIGNETLSDYYRDLADVQSQRGETSKAVEAACGAIVSWGSKHEKRQEALSRLVDVLRRCEDLDAYVTGLDREVEETRLDNPLVRKALGRIYHDRKAWDEAIVQLDLAVASQPNDIETHKLLIACHDGKNDPQGAIARIHAAVELMRRDISMYHDLGRRYEEVERPDEAERARTSIIEALPLETESHTMLAEIRQQQDRWDEAIPHWQRVADLRNLEPTGLVKLATAQIHQKQFDAAGATLDQLQHHVWPSRFGNVSSQIHNLQRQIDAGR